MRSLAALLGSLLVVTTMTAPVGARPNDHRFQQSSEAMRQQMVDCAFYKNMLDAAERDADARAGTKAAAKYAKEADKWWRKGEQAGCGWAA
ncbi:MAG TPA: hypothetical protein GYA10_12085 [Alphaproteobacteria bacterium]|nr:hypothetical protein [Alphaproteobacteria bacterium]